MCKKIWETHCQYMDISIIDFRKYVFLLKLRPYYVQYIAVSLEPRSLVKALAGLLGGSGQ